MSLPISLPTDCFWVAIEGADKVGKTTLFNDLLPALSVAFQDSHQVRGMPEVSESPTGKAIVAAYENGHFRLKDKQHDLQIGDALLWFADQYNSIKIATAELSQPTILISDRGPDSRKILQETKLMLQYPFCKQQDVRAWIDSALRFLPLPDLTLAIRTDFSTICKRMQADREYEAYMRSAAEKFDQLPLLHPSRVVQINGDKGTDKVLDCAMRAIESKMSGTVKNYRP